MRRSPATERNRKLGDWTGWVRDNQLDNLAFFKQALTTMSEEFKLGNDGEMTLGFVGSRDIPGVTLRRAQSVLRWDRRPSLWSHVFLIGKPWDGQSNLARLPILEVPLFPRTGRFPPPEHNGLSRFANLNNYRDPEVDANVALITLARLEDDGDASPLKPLSRSEVREVSRRADEPNYDRLRYDLWESLSVWQRYLWSEGEGRNPLREGVPIPASAYVEMAFEAIELDLVPGASERNSAPEHIWNAVVWWHQETIKLDQHRQPYVMTGCYALRDEGCSQL